jgi:hypothetical protein
MPHTTRFQLVTQPGYFARRILPDESFFLKATVIQDLIDAGVIVMRGEKMSKFH